MRSTFKGTLIGARVPYNRHTVIWLYFVLKIFHTLLFCAVLISYAPQIVYETRVKISLLRNIRTLNFRMDGSIRN